MKIITSREQDARLHRVETRLSGYWRMEAANALLVPSAALLLVWAAGGTAGTVLMISMATCSFLLVIGALYWRSVVSRLAGANTVFDYWLPFFVAGKPIGVGFIIASSIGLSTDFAQGGTGWSPSSIASAALIALAVLEYFNYYHFQLQHFDHQADFNRLVAGRGFRRAHLARDISVRRKSLRGAALKN